MPELLSINYNFLQNFHWSSKKLIHAILGRYEACCSFLGSDSECRVTSMRGALKQGCLQSREERLFSPPGVEFLSGEQGPLRLAGLSLSGLEKRAEMSGCVF